MKKIVCIFILFLIGATPSWCQNLQISIDQLGQLALRTEKVTQIAHYTGSPQIATVSEKPGQAYVINAPMNVQRAVFKYPSGTLVTSGEPFLTLIGPEVIHYYSQYKVYEQLFEQSSAMFNKNQKLYHNQSISDASWLNISQQYYDLKFVYDEYHHFFEYVSKVDETSESIVLSAPIEGWIAYAVASSIGTGSNLARFTPSAELRLKINLPLNEARELVSLQLKHCSLNISSTDKHAKSFYLTAWSEPIKESCLVMLGEDVIVTPNYKLDAYQVSKASVFSWRGDNYIFYAQNDYLRAVKVSLISSTNSHYIVSSEQSLNNKNALVTSVSAAQGMLMGLGE